MHRCLHADLQPSRQACVLAVYACAHAGESRTTLAMPGKVTSEALTDFVAAEKLPLTIAFSEATRPKIFKSGIDKHVSVAEVCV